MRKLTFEKAVLIVLILIILISTSDITGKYIDRIIKYFNKPTVSSAYTGKITGFPTMLALADDLFKQENYEGAAEQYLKYSLTGTLTLEQKIYANFRLGVCQFYLGKYDLAKESFIKVTNISTSDSVAYNNAAVSAYEAKDIKAAIELEQKALDIKPTVEYYYNLARMYEDNEEYELSLENYQIVAVGEQNITELQRIDPVRVKERISRLSEKSYLANAELIDRALKVYRLNDIREVFTIDDVEMKLKSGEFLVNVENQKDTKNIVAGYDKNTNDPYNLITDLIWTVYRDGKEFFKKSADKINVKTKSSGNYEVKLSIKYGTNKELVSAKTINIKENQSTVVDSIYSPVGTVEQPVKIPDKTYAYATYEQLFNGDFNLNQLGYTDRYNVLWGKDDVYTQLIDNEAVDNTSSLYVKNSSSNDAGIWLNLDELIDQNDLKGKKVNIRFFARKITDGAILDFKARTTTKDLIILTQKTFDLEYKWKECSMYLTIPNNARGLTISINVGKEQEFKIDTFMIIE